MKKNVILWIILSSLFATNVYAELAIKQVAPDFCLLDQHAKEQCLSAYKGQWVVLYFYPKDDTPGCTKEACSFRDHLNTLLTKDAVILGVSVDDAQSHSEFSKKYKLNFPLLADTQAEVSKSYGALWKIGPLKYAKRHSFIINPQGNIAKIYRDVDPGDHVKEVINDLDKLKASM